MKHKKPGSRSRSAARQLQQLPPLQIGKKPKHQPKSRNAESSRKWMVKK